MNCADPGENIKGSLVMGSGMRGGSASTCGIRYAINSGPSVWI